MNCPRQTPNNMATLLQQQNCIKTLTTSNGVVSNSGNGNTSIGVPSTSTSTGQITATRVLLPHEMVNLPTVSTDSSLQTHQTFQYQQQQYIFYNSTSESSTSSMFRPLATLVHPHQQHHPHQTYSTHNNIPKPLQGVADYTVASTGTNSSTEQPTTNALTAITTTAYTNKTADNHCGLVDDITGGNTIVSNAGDVIEETEPEPEIDIVINNVVCSFSVRCHLNLREIALNGRNVEFRRENGMVTMKLRRPYTTASIWSSGRITCTGATSEDQAKVGARRYARCLQGLGFPVKFRNFRVVNVLGTCSMPWAIKIVNFSAKYKREASYEPELHPGVTYKIKTPKATLKIFSTGSITVTASSVANVQTAIEHIFPLVYEFRKKRTIVEAVPDEKTLMKEITNDLEDFETGHKPKRKKYPFGFGTDIDDDIMCVSDMDDEDRD